MEKDGYLFLLHMIADKHSNLFTTVFWNALCKQVHYWSVLQKKDSTSQSNCWPLISLALVASTFANDDDDDDDDVDSKQSI